MNITKLYNQYYNQPFHIKYADTYHNGWLQAEIDLKEHSYTVIRDKFNSKSSNRPSSLNQYYYDNGYFSYICQYASDNKLI